MRFLQSAVLALWKNRILLPRYKIACCYDCHRVLKHLSKAHDILCRTQQSQASYRFDLHETTHVIVLSEAYCMRQSCTMYIGLRINSSSTFPGLSLVQICSCFLIGSNLIALGLVLRQPQETALLQLSAFLITLIPYSLEFSTDKQTAN